MSSVFKDAIANFLAPIKDLLEDDSISEVMINGPSEIFVEKKGLVFKTEKKFRDDEALLSAVRSIAQSVGRRVDDQNPCLDARLPDGSRIHAVLPPMARQGTTVSIRKFSKQSLGLKDLIGLGTLSQDTARFLDICVFLGKNLLVSGGTGSGKTTFLNVLGGRIPKTQRLIVIEDASELQIEAPHVVSFEAREEQHNVKAINIRDLVKSSMRLRPDRIVVGEVRGPEAMDLLQVMNTGHDGSMGTVHANSPLDACVRLETLALMADTKIPPESIRHMVGSALHLVVQISRFADGGRRVSHITEILGVDKYGQYITQDIFRFFQKGRDENKIVGELVPTGYIPSFFHEIKVNKLPFPKDKFTPPSWAKKVKVAA